MEEKVYDIIHGCPYNRKHDVKMSIPDEKIAQFLLECEEGELNWCPIGEVLSKLCQAPKASIWLPACVTPVRFRHRELRLKVYNIAFDLSYGDHLSKPAVKKFLTEYAEAPTGDIESAFTRYIYQLAKNE
jgi:hypothetical protein